MFPVRLSRYVVLEHLKTFQKIPTRLLTFYCCNGILSHKECSLLLDQTWKYRKLLYLLYFVRSKTIILYHILLDNMATKNNKPTIKVTLLKCSTKIISPNYTSRFGCKVFTWNHKELFSVSLGECIVAVNFSTRWTTMWLLRVYHRNNCNGR